MATQLTPKLSTLRRIALTFLVLNLCCGFLLALLPGLSHASEKRLVIVQSIDLSGPNGDIGRDYVAGITSYFDSLNTSGGLQGKRIHFVVRDDKGDPALAAKMVQELVEREKPHYILGGIGADTTAAILANPGFKQSGLLLFAPLTDANPAHRQRALVWRPNRQHELEVIFNHLEKLGIKNIGIAHIDSAINRDSYAIIQKEIARRNLNLVGSATLTQDGPDNTRQIEKLAQAKPGLVITLADTINTGIFLKNFRKTAPTTFVAGTSMLNLATLGEIAGKSAMEWTVFSQVVPSPHSATTMLQKEHVKVMRKFRDETVSAMSLEGFAIAKTLTRAILAGAGNSFSAMQSFTRANSELDGMDLVRTEGKSSLSQFVDLAMFRRGGSLLY